MLYPFLVIAIIIRLLHLATRMGSLDKIGEFQPAMEDWPQYVERLEFFFTATGITSDDTQRATFLVVIGPTAYKLLRSMLVPVKPD